MSTNSPGLKFLIVAGPTAVGKTDFAIELARRVQTEIINADAFQMYQGFDILAAKPDREQLSGVQHHLLSFLEPEQNFDAYRFARLAETKIGELNRRGLVPLVVGGTGFYLRALTKPLSALPSADQQLRQQLHQQSLADLLQLLRDLDPEAFDRIDRHNPRRVIRAIEVCRKTGRPFSSFLQTASRPSPPAVLLERPRRELAARIAARTETILKQGAIEEVASAGDLHSGAARLIGFRSIRDFLAGKISRTVCQERIRAQTNQYARRQATWFRAQSYRVLEPSSSIELAVEMLHAVASTGQISHSAAHTER
jgi:tRNA dimethylallyltransferase